MAALNISAPWISFYRQINVMFAEDPQVHVVFDEDNYEVKVYVDDDCKAAALERLLVSEKEFGNITVKVKVIPANAEEADRFSTYKMTDSLWWDIAFEDNPVYAFSKVVGNPGFMITYVVFEKRVLQYFNDVLWDYYGVVSTLAQDVAKEIFKPFDGVSYSTDIADGFGSVLGRWP